MTRKTVVIISGNDVKVIVEDENESIENEDIETDEPLISTRSVKTGSKGTPP